MPLSRRRHREPRRSSWHVPTFVEVPSGAPIEALGTQTKRTSRLRIPYRDVYVRRRTTEIASPNYHRCFLLGSDFSSPTCQPISKNPLEFSPVFVVVANCGNQPVPKKKNEPRLLSRRCEVDTQATREQWSILYIE